MLKDHTNQQISPRKVPRRRFFSWAWKILAAAACIEIGWLSGSIFRSSKKQALDGDKKKKIIEAGKVDQFAAGEVKAVPQGQFYLVCLDDGGFLALSRTCTHLGCSVPWDNERQKFICPCHGSSFDKVGTVLTPPAVRPLDYFPVKIEDGLIRVDVSAPLRREMYNTEQTARA